MAVYVFVCVEGDTTRKNKDATLRYALIRVNLKYLKLVFSVSSEKSKQSYFCVAVVV